MRRWSEKDLRALGLGPGINLAGSAIRASKYGNVITVVDGIPFASKLEAQVYSTLCLLKQAGEVEYFLRQVPFHLPGGVIYRVDFQVFYYDNERRARYLDAKGAQTKEFKIKKRLVESLYPVQIELVTRQGKRLVGL